MATNGTATDPTTADPPPPSSTAPPPPPSTSDEPSSPPPPSSSPPSTLSPTPTPSSTRPEPTSDDDVPTSTVTAPSRTPSTTVVSTSVVTPEPTAPGDTPEPSTIIRTITNPPSDQSQPTSGADQAPSSTSTSPAGLQGVNKGANDGGGLSSGGKIGIAVAVPIVVIALLVFAGILFWRKRKQRKNAEEARRKEVEEYGFNPNNDPRLPAVGIASEMGEDQSGYRGWGNTTTSSNRKASTTLTSGMTYSDSTSNPGGGPHSPTQADAQSNDAQMNGRRETLDAEGFGAMGAMGNNYNNNLNGQPGVHRGPSNASSSYSAAGRSDTSGDYPIPMSNPQEYYDQHNNYYHPEQYQAYSDPYAGQPQPIIRDVPARRNTRIESPSVFPPQGNSGIAQNF